ncbi:hypothetical protein HDV00_009794 [Rhizophlyctis rosea]|nr:hypothetical protein HDV00_009794 [Rhizophlyctis rosea]
MSNTGIELPPDVLVSIPQGWTVTTPIAQNGGSMCAVTAPWCGYCTELKQSVTEAQFRRPFDFFYMDGDKHKQQVSKMGIDGFPAIYGIAPGGLLVPYKGAMDPQTLASAIYKNRNL